MNFLDLFAGIGGFHLAAEMADLEFRNCFYSEINEFSQKIYKQHWPRSTALGDVRSVDGRKLPSGRWLVTAGFPCQPFSIAGLGLGKDDDRYLWGEVVRILKELRGEVWFIGENVPNIANVPFSISDFEVASRKRYRTPEKDYFEGVYSFTENLQLYRCCEDLEEAGFEVAVFEIPAIGYNAPHLRNRIWIIAHADGRRCENEQEKDLETFQDSKRNGTTQKSERIEQCRTRQSDTIPSDFDSQNQSNGRFKQAGKSQHRNPSSELADSNGNRGPKRQRRQNKQKSHTDTGIKGFADLAEFGGEKGEQNAKTGFGDQNTWHDWVKTATKLCGMDDGLSSGLDITRLRADLGRLYPNASQKDIDKAIEKLAVRYRRLRIEACGNSIVPIVASGFMKAINRILEK